MWTNSKNEKPLVLLEGFGVNLFFSFGASFILVNQRRKYILYTHKEDGLGYFVSGGGFMAV